MQTPLICPTIKKHNELGEKMQKKGGELWAFRSFLRGAGREIDAGTIQ